MGRKPLTAEQRAQQEKTQDVHLWLPVSLIEKIDNAQDTSRKEWIVQAIREKLERDGGTR